MITSLNTAVPELSNAYMELRGVTIDLWVVIHGISLEATTNNDDILLLVMQESFFIGQ